MRKRRLVLLLLSTVAVLGGAGVAAEVPEMAKRLPGKYELTYKGTLLRLNAVKSYHPDGTYESVGTASILGITRKLIHRGSWKYENGYLVYTLTESSTPKEAPTGEPLKFKVIAHDGKIMKYHNEMKDEEYTEKRIGEAGE